ncbi:hypothetical protein O181_046062 [Austropuccinia psidii MF-1]|uniref:Uncharacterized protein n=1 Tax=Austropuccinia psidii MF-1 TaxID=1389203 RepID=A0A9Q3DQI8_9BASI|nr:hypothetical protein [Austropuccinia psidii MF-1]
MCLYLPSSVQYKSQYMFVAGMIPAPNQPNMITMSNVLKPLVKDLLELNHPKRFQTHQFPLGLAVVVHLGALIGDVVATHKAAGFSSHSASKFCSWCNISKKDISKLKIIHPQNKNDTLALAHRWHDGKRLTERDNLTKNLVKESTEDSEKDQQNSPSFDQYDSTEDEIQGQFFSNGFKNLPLKPIGEVFVPAGVTPIPKHVRKAKNGKLKASEWHSLSAIHLSLAFVDTLIKFQTLHKDIVRYQIVVENTCSLIGCTNIVSSKAYNKDQYINFQRNYEIYTKTSKILFRNLKVLPNHHYALHIPEQMRWWGALIAVLEFPAERLIGKLQKLNKNSRSSEFLLFFAEEKFSKEFFSKEDFGSSLLQHFCEIQIFEVQNGLELATNEKIKNHRIKKFQIELNDYDWIWRLFVKKKPDLRPYHWIPHPEKSNILLNEAKELHFIHTGRGWTIFKKSPNYFIQYFVDGKQKYGRVLEIFELTDPRVTLLKGSLCKRS